jgi:ABC-type antimicrobial peptide transport system permease subunit
MASARPLSLPILSLRYFWRGHLAVALGVAVGTAALTGALLVGDSMRGSLRETALSRLGPVEAAMVAPRFFRDEWCEAVSDAARPAPPAAPLMILPGAAAHADSGARANRVNLYGVDERIQRLFPGGAGSIPAEGEVVVNEPLARALGATAGEEILLRLEKRQAVPVETLLGRRDELAAVLRLRIAGIGGPAGLADLDLRPRARRPLNAFVSLAVLQRVLKRSGRVNAILAAGVDSPGAAAGPDDGPLETALGSSARLEDYGLRIRRDMSRGYFCVESDGLLLEPAAEEAVRETARALGMQACGVLSYLVNDMRLEASPAGGRRAAPAVPYSTAAALVCTEALELIDGRPAPALGPDEVLLNEWASADLGARVGDRILLEYYVSKPMGRLETDHAIMTLRGIVRLQGWGADPGLTPTYEGITDSSRITDWNPPFPMDMSRIRQKDEHYWRDHRATPKVFLSLEAGLKRWAEPQPRHGRLTSIRILPAAGHLEPAAEAFETALLRRLRPADFGLRFEPVRRQAIEAAGGSTDFGMLFLGFSSFLILSAAMLVALLFRLGVDRRASQLGLLLAVGWTRRSAARFLLVEGGVVAATGVAAGSAGAMAYAWLMLAGLRSWWAEAVNAPFLRLHLSAATIVIGAAASLLIGLLAMIWALRAVVRVPPRRLLAGQTQPEGREVDDRRGRGWRAAGTMAALAAAMLIGLSAATGTIPPAIGFFAGGALVLASAMAFLTAMLSPRRPREFPHPGGTALVRLGLRNTARNRGRSLLTAGLIACASFVLVAVGANRHSVGAGALSPSGGTGGYALMGESVVSLAYDLATAEGRAGLGLSPQAGRVLQEAEVVSFRLREGDDASCLNLYQAGQPRILGATPAFIEAGGFAFASSLAETVEEQANPWRLLGRPMSDGAVPCIADANTVRWLLHLGLGQDLVVPGERGRAARLRIVGMLSRSVLQGELVIAERDFVRLFPSVAGYRAVLIRSAESTAGEIERVLEQELAPHGMDLESTPQRLAEFQAVENTYLSAFQLLGGLGLVLGTLGLAAVTQRNALERRGELALLRAVGLRHTAIAGIVLAENVALLAAGILAGALPALLASAPHLAENAGGTPWASLGVTLAGVAAAGAAAGAAGLRTALRTPLLPALRRE